MFDVYKVYTKIKIFILINVPLISDFDDSTVVWDRECWDLPRFT